MQPTETNQTAALATTSAGKILIKDRQIPLEELPEMFVRSHSVNSEGTRALYRRALRQFVLWIKNPKIEKNTPLKEEDLEHYKAMLLQEKSPLTAASYLNAVKLFYTWLHNNNATIENIAAGMKLPSREKKFEREPLTTEQAAELLQLVKEEGSLRDYAVISLLLHTGMRTIEVARANIKDLQRIGEDIVLYVQGKGKQSKNNFVPISQDTYEALQAYLETRPGATPKDPLFIAGVNRNKEGRISARSVSAIARRHLDEMGLSHEYGERNSKYTAHSFRHTYGCAMLEATEDYHIVQLLMRHASPNTTQQYVYHLEKKRRIKIAKQYNIDNIYKR